MKDIIENSKKVCSTRRLLIRPLIIAALFLLVACPLGFAGVMFVGASSDANMYSSTSESGESYNFAIIDDGQVPLAAVPKTHYSEYVFLTIGILVVAIAIFSYTYWYIIVCKNIAELSVMLTPVERSSIAGSISMLHPYKLVRAEKEAEAYVANKYFDFL